MKIQPKHLVWLLFIICIAIFFRFYQLEQRFAFGWDQERDAQMMWQMIKEHKLTLIGPRAVGPSAFFLGPLWYYLLLPAYLLSNLDPIGAAYFGGLIGIITTITIYLVVKELFSYEVALITSFIWAIYPDRGVWNPSLIPLLSILFIFLIIKIQQGHNKYIPYSMLLFGLSLQIHFQTIVYGLGIFLSIFFYYRNYHNLPVQKIFIGISLFLLTFFPLILFDLRHNFINSVSAFKFFFNHSNFSDQHFDAITKFLAEVTSLLPHILVINSFLIGIVTLTLSTIGVWSSHIPKQSKLLVLSLILFPLILFSFYRGNLCEYYFALILIPLLIGIGLLMNKIFHYHFFGKVLVIILLILIFVLRMIELFAVYDGTSLYFRRQTVAYIVQQKQDPIFNISYSTPINQDAGFRYLFKLSGREPQNIPQGHLWTIVIPPNAEKTPPKAIFGDIGIIRR